MRRASGSVKLFLAICRFFLEPVQASALLSPRFIGTRQYSPAVRNKKGHPGGAAFPNAEALLFWLVSFSSFFDRCNFQFCTVTVAGRFGFNQCKAEHPSIRRRNQVNEL